MVCLILEVLFNPFITQNDPQPLPSDFEVPCAEKCMLFSPLNLTTEDRSFCIRFGQITRSLTFTVLSPRKEFHVVGNTCH
jgi:hypothetical protein